MKARRCRWAAARRTGARGAQARTQVRQVRQAVRKDDAAQRAPVCAELLVARRAAQQQHHGLAAIHAQRARLQPLGLHQPPHRRACARRARVPRRLSPPRRPRAPRTPRACWP